MAAKKKTLGQKRDERNAKIAATKPVKKLGGDRIDAVIELVNKRLGGNGRVYRGTVIQQRAYLRRDSGIPSINYITCGGYPKGGLVEFGGEFSTGKTSVALEALIVLQREYLTALRNGEKPEKLAVAWIGLEPFSKKWARERGFFIPFCEDLVPDQETGELKPLDSFADASSLELYRMEQAGITDPYTEITPFVLVEEWRGDVALDASLDLIKSNQFAYVVVDSLGVAKSTTWMEDKEVQDASDFPREAKMIGDYTVRALLALNGRYDENNMLAKDGTRFNETTIIHINQITTAVGVQAYAKYKTQTIKGGEGNKHNHHAIIFLWKGEQYQVDAPKGSGQPPYRYAQEVRCICLKSKLGPDQMEGSFDFYRQPYGHMQTGDFDVVKDLVGLALIAGTVTREGAWYQIDADFRAQGKENFADKLRANPDWYAYLAETTKQAMKRK